MLVKGNNVAQEKNNSTHLSPAPSKPGQAAALSHGEEDRGSKREMVLVWQAGIEETVSCEYTHT